MFYVKTIKLRPKMTTREREPKMVAEGTVILPPDQLPMAPQRVRDVPPTVGMDLKRQHIPTFGTKQEPAKAPRDGSGRQLLRNGAATARCARSSPRGRKRRCTSWARSSRCCLSVDMLRGYFSLPHNAGWTAPLVMSSTPPGAEVWVGGQLLGKTPLEFKDKKDMDLTFKLNGYKRQNHAALQGSLAAGS